MGDQVRVTVSGALYYVPFKEFERVRALPVTPVEKTALFAALCRINTLYMIARAGSGHIGSSFSSMDIMSWMHLNELRTPSDDDTNAPRDLFFSSKGHDAPGFYSTLIGMGKLEFDLIHKLRRSGGLPGHPDIGTPNIVTNTGSLGMGVSKAKGMVLADRLLNCSGNVYVLTGDGELQEGQFWESLGSAANKKMHELTVIIDHNKMQSDTLVSKVSDLGDLEAKLAAFGWYVSRCDGNDLNAFSKTLSMTKKIFDKPKVIIADTVKGKGVSFMEHTSIDSDVDCYRFHSGAPTEDDYLRAAQELVDAANVRLRSHGASLLKIETVIRPVAAQLRNPQRLIRAYSNALIDQTRKNPKIVALDADLILDTGLVPFQKEFPNRFVECGIAEQDMVTQAGGMALRGLLPIVHSFACFLSARPNEQIYNNATERKKIIYVGSLAGVLPGGPGHSHQAIRDIATMASIPGLIAIEPSCEDEVVAILDWCIREADGPCYIRLNSLPWPIDYQRPEMAKAVFGRGQVLKDGDSIAVISHGPAMLLSVLDAARRLYLECGQLVRVINLPWLNYVDPEWLDSSLRRCDHVVTVEDHYEVGGQSDVIARVLMESIENRIQHTRIGVRNIPECGTTAEVLAIEGLDGGAIEEKLNSLLQSKKI